LAGFLHRDIKPANILLDAGGNPTLIDFGASRAAMAGRSAVMTAIFTPGYAAAEQMTAARQGPWTDIYGLSATLYHAIAGTAPPSSFDRMVEDEYRPLAQLPPADFAPGLLVGLDAGLAVKATDRPQSIAGWRPILGQVGAVSAPATVMLSRGGATVAPAPAPQPTLATAPPAAAGAGSKGVWIAIAAAILLVLGGGGYYVSTKQSEAELARLRQEKAERDKADAEAALRRQIEEETRQKLAAEEAERRRQADEQRAAQRRAQEEARRAAEHAETALRHTILNRQHIQVSLASLGYDPGPIEGVYTPRTREALAAWQRSRNFAPTGFLDGPQYQALMRQGAVAIAKFDESQRKLDDDRKAAEAKREAEEDAQRRAAVAPPPVAPPTAAAVPPPAASAQPADPDGLWQGIYECPARAGGEPLRVTFSLNVRNGTGTWVPNMTRGTLSVTVSIAGNKVQITRLLALNTTASTPMFPPAQFTGPTRVFTLDGTLNGDIINAQGTETPPGRLCTAIINRR
jgi:peptidoglycan hydrolase-like protein with peptidoglycan-binding domain